jgi:hypothetical protein
MTKIAPDGARDGTHRRWTIDKNGDVSLTRKFWCLAEDEYKIAEYFLGKTKEQDGRLRRLLPLTDDKDTTFVATGISVNQQHKYTGPLGADPLLPGDRTTNPAPVTKGVDGGFAKTKFEVRYTRVKYRMAADVESMPPVDEEAQRFVELLEPRPASSILTLPGHAMKYVRDAGGGTNRPHGNIIPYNIPKIFPQIELPVIWHNLPSSMFQFSSPGEYLKRYLGWVTGTPVKPYWGKINKYDFLGFRAHTLLLTDWRLVPRPSLVPEPGYLSIDWDVHYTWLYDPNRHSYKWFNDVSPFTGPSTNQSGFYEVTVDGVYYAPGSLPDNTGIFDEIDFNDLFKVT